MSDATTDFARMLSPQPGDRFELDHGTIRIDRVADEQVYFVRWKGPTQHGDPMRMPMDVYREAVRRYLTRNDQPTMTCPRCKAELPDFDGVGVLAHTKPAYDDGCGYCTHPSLDGDVCGICGKTINTHGGEHGD